MNVLKEGNGKLVGWEHPDDVNRWKQAHKSQALEDKRTGTAEAVDEYDAWGPPRPSTSRSTAGT